MRGRLLDLTYSRDRRQRITVEIDGDFAEAFDELKGGDVTLEVKKWHRRRSLGANALLWEICQQIGNALSPPLPKDEVYRNAIRDVGVFTPLPIKNEDLESFGRRWGANGTGWFVDIVGDSKLQGYKHVHAYYGSSTYDAKEMSVLLEHLTSEAEQMGIRLITNRYE